MSSPSICVIDDESEVLDGICYQLKPMGAVRGFTSPQEALAEIVRGYRPDVTIVDLKMPEMSGLEFIANSRELLSPSQIVLSSGNASRQDLGKAINQGVAAFVEKPFSGEQLRSTVSSVLDSRAQHFEIRSELFEELASVYWDRLLLVENQLFALDKLRFESHSDTKKYLDLKVRERELQTAIAKTLKRS